MEPKMDLDRSDETKEASRKSLESNATPGSLDEENSSADAHGIPVSPTSASAVDEPGENPWSEVMKDLARLVVAAYEADPHRFD